jgi:hypothetical protein
VDPSGNVGIGTNSPAQSLEVEGITSLGPAGSVYGYSVNGSTPGPYPTIGFNAYGPSYIAGATGYGGILQFENGDGKLIYYTGSNVSVGTAHANVPRFTIAANGRVGIGTTSPVNGQLHVEAVDSTAIYANTANTGLGMSDGVVAFSDSGQGVYGSSTSNVGVLGTSTSSFGIAGESTSAYGVWGFSSTNYAGYFQGNVLVTGCLVASNLSCPSDERLKRDITPLSYGLREVLRLRPVTWQWKDATRTEPNMGLVAQDVEPVLPELIIHNADNKGSLGLNYMGLIPVLIKGMQEQQAQIVEQQEQNREQKEQNRKLEERLAALEKLLSTIQPSTADR